ncbi:MAG TPA: PHP domain-containing protein [Planctomycetota bacterium]|nr:PHP domain-containing protein [Planctomycetota bacterium]
MIVARSCYSFLNGPSTPAALVARASALGMKWLALADDESLAGAVPFWTACRSAGIKPVLGARLGGRVYLIRNRAGYAALCRAITKRRLTTETPRHREEVIGTAPQEGSAPRLRASVADLEGVVEVERVTDATFATKQEWRVHRLLSAIRQNELVAHVEGLASPEAYLRNDLDAAPEDGRIAESCDWEFLPAPKVFPRDQGGMERLRALCRAGLPWRYPANPPLERLERELGVIGKLGYADYFVVVHDIVTYSRARGLPVAGRGSGASSVVAYLLGITNVCPVAYDLPFERFLHEGRLDYPDIDVDFSWRVRDDVIAHVFERFGDVAMVSTHITFQHRSAFREAAKAFGYSDEQVSLLQRGRVNVPDRAKLERAAAAILGLPRHFSVHPGGVVLHPGGVAPLERAEKGVLVTQYDKETVEAAGLVKIDLLGNRALSTIRETVEIVERTTGARLDVERLPVDEPAVRLLREARTLGCNQLESPAMRSLIRMMRPSDAKGLMKALALIRPGAASLGMKEAFIRRERGLEPVPPRGLLPDTHEIMLYEDDAMLVASALTGLSLADGDRFRRRVQKLRTDDERRAVSREFLDLCVRHGTDPAVAKDLWIQMAKFTEFSFCRAHAASYAVLAWASCWLAAHHPVAHWVAALNNNQGLYDARVYLEQAKREGIPTRLPCAQTSGLEFTEEGGAIRVGFNRIYGIEQREIAQILEARPFSSLGDFLARTKISKPSLRNLALCGALDWTGLPRPQVLMFARARGIDVPALRDFSEIQKFTHEFEILGLSARRHILTYLAPPSKVDSRAIAGAAGKRITLLGIMATSRLTETAKSEPMEFLTMEDEHGLFEVVLFPQVFRRCRPLIGTLGPYEVSGKVEERYDSVAITAESIRPVRGQRSDFQIMWPAVTAAAT